jgi:hypothetical protein
MCEFIGLRKGIEVRLGPGDRERLAAVIGSGNSPQKHVWRARRLKRGVFKGIVDLQAAINRFLQETNANPKPFVWTADPDAIIEKVRRGKQVLASIH